VKLRLVDRRERTDVGPQQPAWDRDGRLWRLLVDLCARLGEPDWPVDLVLVEDGHMARLNRRWRDRDGATDVLSFSYLAAHGAGAPALAAGCAYARTDLWLDRPDDTVPVTAVGEIVIAPRLVAARCRELGVEPEAELALLTVHGGLHLLGWQHDEPEARSRMRAVEAELLRSHNLPHPLQEKE
jgi:probable rRNA maturation factor